MIQATKQLALEKMQKTVEAFSHELSKIRAGRAHIGLVDQLQVNYHGSAVPMSSVAAIAVVDARTLSVRPWEKTMLKVIEKAILEADLGLNPLNKGDVLYLPLPALTEERRHQLVKQAKAEAEHARVAVRNIRREANAKLKDLLQAKDVSEDEARRAEEDVQKLTNKHMERVEQILEGKEKDLLSF